MTNNITPERVRIILNGISGNDKEGQCGYSSHGGPNCMFSGVHMDMVELGKAYLTTTAQLEIAVKALERYEAGDHGWVADEALTQIKAIGEK